MEVTKLKKPEQYNKNTKSYVSLISYKNTEALIMGSSSMKFNYASDYDLFSIVYTDSSFEKLKNEVWNGFSYMMNKIAQAKNAYFIEFMCGVDKEEKPLKWAIKDVLNGTHEGYKFIDVLNDRSVIKVEIVVYYDSRFVPFSNVFEFKKSDGTGINQEKTTLDSVDSLKREVKKFYEKKNFMKVLKRLFVISLTEKNKNLSEKLISIFQSDIGKIYKVKSDIDTIKKVLELYHDNVTLERVHNTFQMLKETLATQSSYSFPKKVYDAFDKTFQSKDHKNIILICDELMDTIMKAVNSLLKIEIKQQKISFKKYL